MNKIKLYIQGRHFRLQKNAWTSQKVFFAFLRTRLRPRVGSPSVIFTLLFLMLAVPAVLSLVSPTPVHAVNNYLNFQSRLMNADGSLVQDGNYHIEFKIYSGGDGDLGGGDETLEWTETRSTGNLVRVVNGYISVSLGDVTSLNSVDWSSSPMWLSMNIGGSG